LKRLPSSRWRKLMDAGADSIAKRKLRRLNLHNAEIESI